jgi:hypothetical protein
LLSGEGYLVSVQKGAVKKHVNNSLRGVRPLSEYDGSGWISPYNTKSPIC